MREQTSLIKQFDEAADVVAEPQERSKREGERDALVLKSFKLPTRNWVAIIEDFNAKTKRKFPLTALQCTVILEYIKRGIPPRFLFKTLGQNYSNLTAKASELENRLALLASKDTLSDDEYEEFQSVLRNPYRILGADIDRAEGLADLFDWEQFNEMSRQSPDILMAKMKAKFKDIFSDKDQASQGINVQINLGGDWISEL